MIDLQVLIYGFRIVFEIVLLFRGLSPPPVPSWIVTVFVTEPRPAPAARVTLNATNLRPLLPMTPAGPAIDVKLKANILEVTVKSLVFNGMVLPAMVTVGSVFKTTDRPEDGS